MFIYNHAAINDTISGGSPLQKLKHLLIVLVQCNKVYLIEKVYLMEKVCKPRKNNSNFQKINYAYNYAVFGQNNEQFLGNDN